MSEDKKVDIETATREFLEWRQLYMKNLDFFGDPSKCEGLVNSHKEFTRAWARVVGYTPDTFLQGTFWNEGQEEVAYMELNPDANWDDTTELAYGLVARTGFGGDEWAKRYERMLTTALDVAYEYEGINETDNSNEALSAAFKNLHADYLMSTPLELLLEEGGELVIDINNFPFVESLERKVDYDLADLFQ